MPNILDHIAYLSQSVGPRPAGTEEEQQAALYITEQLQQEAHLPTVIEDFNGTSGKETARIVCCAATLIVTVLSLVFSVMAIPSLAVTIAAALLVVAEVLNKPVLSKLFKGGVSQNVVAHYEPGYSPELGGTRRRKIVLLARYDSGKVDSSLNGPLAGMLPVLKKASLAGMVAVPVVLLVKNLFFLHATGVAAVIMTTLTVIALVLAILPLVGAIVKKFAAYNEAANCNAAGVAVLLDVAARVGEDASFSSSPSAGSSCRQDSASFSAVPEPIIHGEAAAYAAQVVPEGAQVVYEETASVQIFEEEQQSPEARLLAAKAAVAALTGRPVSSTVMVPLSEVPTQNEDAIRADLSEEISAEELMNGTEANGAGDEEIPSEVVFAGETVSEEVAVDSFEGETVEGFSNVPAWFKKAQMKARKPVDAPTAQRSRYADALDAALSESTEHFTQANKTLELTTEQRLQQIRESIMETKAPEARRDFVEALVADAEPVKSAASQLFIPSLVMQQQEIQTDAAPADTTQAIAPVDVTALKAEMAFKRVAPAPRRTLDLPSFDALPLVSAASESFESELGSKSDPSILSSNDAAGSILSVLPSIEVTQSEPKAEPLDLPSLASTTVAFAPVSEELMEKAISSDDMYVEDADDSGYERNYGDAGSFAPVDYVEMPQSRLQRLFSRFGRKKKERELSTQEWLDVDETFDARSVGAARGSWESFRDDFEPERSEETEDMPNTYEEYDSFGSSDSENEDDYGYEETRRGRRSRRWNGGGYSRSSSAAYDGYSADNAGEYEQIQHFYHAALNTEVWFVALGSELSGNNGMKAFVKEHAQDLRGAILIELDALGAGDLRLIDEEGSCISAKTPSRMKRYVKKAAAEAGMTVPGASLLWNDSASSYAIKQGYQAMHLVGMDGSKPAYYGQKDDVLENIDEDVLLRNADFVMGLLRII